MNQSTTDPEGVQLRVEGKVQGVGFRWWTRERAEELQLAGTVRNLQDRSVEIIAYGTPEALSEFRRVVGDGPPSARIDRVTETPLVDSASRPIDFRILP